MGSPTLFSDPSEKCVFHFFFISRFVSFAVCTVHISLMQLDDKWHFKQKIPALVQRKKIISSSKEYFR